MSTWLLATLAVTAGAVVQATTGFGFALVAAPALVAVLGPEQGITVILVLSTVLAVLMMRRKGQSLSSHVRPLLAWAAPGVPVGALALATLPADALAIVVSVAVVTAIPLVRPRPGTAPRWSAPAAGFAAGAMTASTSLNGPPLVFHLVRSGLDAADVRATLAACFLVLDIAGLAALAIGGVFDAHPSIPLLAVAALAGQRLGARIAPHLDEERWGQAVRVVLVLSAVALAARAAL